uniref:transmembrane protein 169-like n=1 Tax=Styela clava TaxID=7725 RepID=UPI00193A695E|nr:transmembrane protein 169-like [Styela clava]
MSRGSSIDRNQYTGVDSDFLSLSRMEGNVPQQNVGSRIRDEAPNNYARMTLDGRKRPKPGNNGIEPNIRDGDQHWHDWTCTWRKVGAKGHSQPVTMTGTITRGKKKGQVVDVRLDLTERELLEISSAHEQSHNSVPDSPDSMPSSLPERKDSDCGCGLQEGPHIILLSILAFPFILIASMFASFYFGALTWQNIFNHFYDERTIWHRIFICPLLVIAFPLIIVFLTLGISIYAAFVQLRWSFTNWKDEVGSLEKGFCGWLCGILNLEDCSPYTVVELFDTSDTENGQRQSQHQGRCATLNTEQNSETFLPSRGSITASRDRNSLPTAGGSASHRMESAL